MKHFFSGPCLVGLCLVACAAMTIAHHADARSALSPAAFQSKIIGNTLHTRQMGMGIAMRFEADGRMSIRAPIRSGYGRWHFNAKNQLCVNITSGPDNRNGCGHLYDLGDGRRYQGSKGRIWELR